MSNEENAVTLGQGSVFNTFLPLLQKTAVPRKEEFQAFVPGGWRGVAVGVWRGAVLPSGKGP